MSEEQVTQAPSGVLEVSAKKEGYEAVTVMFDFGADLDAMIEKFGANVVHTNARAAMKVTLQSVIRRYITADKSAGEIEKIVSDWKPGVQLERVVDPIGALKRQMSEMSDEEKQALIAKLLG